MITGKQRSFLKGLAQKTDPTVYIGKQGITGNVIKEMETRYSEKITISQLSSLVFVTPQYLSRLFRRFLGCSAYEYLTTYRLNKAKELLLVNSRMEIQYIAQQVGFEDSSHFIDMFRKMTGVTPMEFRVLYRNIGL